MKTVKATVRSHGEERQYLLSLGNGDIVKGVRQLAEQLKSAQAEKKRRRRRKK